MLLGIALVVTPFVLFGLFLVVGRQSPRRLLTFNRYLESNSVGKRFIAEFVVTCILATLLFMFLVGSQMLGRLPDNFQPDSSFWIVMAGVWIVTFVFRSIFRKRAL
jgi:glycerol uptake facilitator-like aquaporin